MSNTSATCSDNIVCPFVFDASYKGDELTRRVAEIIGTDDISGWSIVDTFENLVMLHYNEDADKHALGHLRGIVIDTVSGDIIAKSFGHTPVAVVNQLAVNNSNFIVVRDQEQMIHSFPMSEVIIRRVTEGVTIRVIWYNNRVYYLTHRKINPTKSRWIITATFLSMYQEAGGPTEHELFDTSVPYSSTCYVFMVCHPDLIVATRQQVKKPYIVHLASYELSLSKPADQIAPGLIKYKFSTEISGCVDESYIHEPQQLTLDQANYHLSYGFYKQYDTYDPRQLTGEAVLLFLMEKGEVIDIVKVHSPSYDWRFTMRGNNPMITHQFYSMLNIVYPDINNEDDWKRLTEKLIPLPLYPVDDLKQLYETNKFLLVMPSDWGTVTVDTYVNRDDRIHLLWLNFLISLPLHLQVSALEILSNYHKEKNELADWICKLEAEDINVFLYAEQVKDDKKLKRLDHVIKAARNLARSKVSTGANYSQKGNYQGLHILIKTTIKNLLNKENGPSLYGLIKTMRKVKSY